jgi:DNA replication protein DnaC
MLIEVLTVIRSCAWQNAPLLAEMKNLLITGSTGIGKSYVASAIGHQACILGYRVMYASTPKLFAKLKMAKADGSYIKEITKIELQQLLILAAAARTTLVSSPSMPRAGQH